MEEIEAADALIKQYESVRFTDVHAPVLPLIPSIPAWVLDIGSGTGRDAAALAAMGQHVVAVEPTAAFRTRGAALHSSARIEWIDDKLPSLSRLMGCEQGFDLVMLTAVSSKGGQMTRTGTARVALSVWLAALSLWPAASRAQTLDPQSLLGEWHGTWTDPRVALATGSCTITVKKIEGAKVFIHVHLAGPRSTEVDREGTLSGNVLTVETAANTTVLTIEGDRMSGVLQSVLMGVPVQEITFNLHKKK